MQKWEYCEMEITIGGPISGVSAVVAVLRSNGKHDYSRGQYGDLIAKLGTEGWELVTSSARIEAGLGSKHKLNLFFKRPLA